METLVYTVGELPAASRVAAEQLVGHPLSASQRILIEVSAPAMPVIADGNDGLPPLPEWFNVYEGLTDADIDAITETILSNRFDLGRPVVE